MDKEKCKEDVQIIVDSQTTEYQENNSDFATITTSGCELINIKEASEVKELLEVTPWYFSH